MVTGTLPFTPGPDGAKITSVAGIAPDGNGIITVTGTGYTLAVTAATGAYTYTLTSPMTHDAGAGKNASLDQTFSYTVTDGDGDTVDSILTVTVKDDVPEAVNDDIADAVTEGNTVSGNVLTNDDSGADGWDATRVVTSIGFGDNTLVTALDGTGKIVVNGQYGTLTLNPVSGEYTYAADPDLNHASGVVEDVFTYTVTDSDNDLATATLKITVDDGDGPQTTNGADNGADGNPAVVTVNEDGSASTEGALTFTAGSDAIASVAFGNAEGATLTLTGADGSENVTVKSVTGNTMVVSAGADNTVTLTLAPNAADNTAIAVSGVLNGSFAHLNGDGATPLTIGRVTVVATDTDGDTVTAGVSIVVNDAGPGTSASDDGIAESAINTEGISVMRTLEIDYGADGTANTGGLRFPQGGIAAPDGLTSRGASISYGLDETGTVLTATAGTGIGARDVFTVALNPDTKAYTFTLKDTLDHAPSSGSLDLGFSYTVTDGDGDTVRDTFTVTVNDDGPTAKNNSVSIEEGASHSGNVVSDEDPSSGMDTSGADDWRAPGTLVSVQYKDATYTFDDSTTSHTINTDAGGVVINQDGSYTFTAASDAEDGETLTDALTYTVSDGDGDLASAVLSLATTDGTPTAGNDTAAVIVSEVSGSGSPKINMVLILDTSTSMIEEGKGGVVTLADGSKTTRFALATQAIVDLIQTYGDALGKVMLVSFSDTAKLHTVDGEKWLSGEQVGGLLGNPTQFNFLNSTDYDHALDVARTNYTAPAEGDTRVYFLSDGSPYGYDASGGVKNYNGIKSDECATWEGFLENTSNNITDVYAVGIDGDFVSDDQDKNDQSKSHLDTVAWSSSNNNPTLTWTEQTLTSTQGAKDLTTQIVIPTKDHSGNTIHSTNALAIRASDLSAVLKGTLGVKIGSLLDNDTFGADGPAGGTTTLTSVTWGETSYPFDPVNDPDRTFYAFETDAGTLIVNNDGRYTFRAKADVTETDSISYTIKDSDGSRDTGTLSMSATSGVALGDDDSGEGGCAQPTPVIQTGTTGSDTISGDAGDDYINGGDGNDTITGGAGDDYLSGHNNDDTIHGNAGADVIFGGTGHDVIWGDESNDILFGEGGNDTIFGGEDDYYISGGDGIDTLFGDAGHDKIFGDGGDDTISGGAGNDILDGGAGGDTFVYESIGDGHDTINNFVTAAGNSSLDTIDLDALFDALGVATSNRDGMVSITPDTGTGTAKQFVVSITDHSEFSITVNTLSNTTDEALMSRINVGTDDGQGP
ncbi:MAG: outer membrane adhesin-like protein [Rhodospirillaceae bacterium]|nr:MAG: outer membrane adhesin-like protein [Rhodospirillaceae bacterium]